MENKGKKAPEGMVPVEEYAKQTGIQEDRIIEMVRDGSLVGQVIEEQWYIKDEVVSSGNKNNRSEKNISISENKPVLSTLFFILAALSIIGGIYYSIETNNSVWLIAGFSEAALLAAMGQGLSYLHQIVINTSK